MGNCYKLFINGRLFGVFKSQEQAYMVWQLTKGLEDTPYTIELAFVENIGF